MYPMIAEMPRLYKVFVNTILGRELTVLKVFLKLSPRTLSDYQNKRLLRFAMV